VIECPGHTFGHCALHLADRDVLFTGDALVTRDPYTGGIEEAVAKARQAGAAYSDCETSSRSMG
jgi:glyoxylase-like metal-dependent hydrolase (beta-lactamase superfamily II)